MSSQSSQPSYGFTDDELSTIPAIKIPHTGIGLPDAIEEMENRFPVGGQLHFRAKIHIDVKIVAQSAIRVHHQKSSFRSGENKLRNAILRKELEQKRIKTY